MLVVLVVEVVVVVAAVEAAKVQVVEAMSWAERTMVQVILKGPAGQADRISFG